MSHVDETAVSENKAWFGDKTYDTLKWIAQILLPALGTLYAAVGAIWGLAYVQEVVTTIVAVDTFLGALLGLSAKGYNASYDGQLETSSDGLASMSIDLTAEEIANKGTVTLKVV